MRSARRMRRSGGYGATDRSPWFSRRAAQARERGDRATAPTARRKPLLARRLWHLGHRLGSRFPGEIALQIGAPAFGKIAERNVALGSPRRGSRGRLGGGPFGKGFLAIQLARI